MMSRGSWANKKKSSCRTLIGVHEMTILQEREREKERERERERERKRESVCVHVCIYMHMYMSCGAN